MKNVSVGFKTSDSIHLYKLLYEKIENSPRNILKRTELPSLNDDIAR